ncbi:MAG: response regulator, partial [Selenomonadaceae bacterium]|nr:response regulator [Selenomonadaceae bacterium]
TKNRMTDISGTEYVNVYESNMVKNFRDYIGKYVSCFSKKNMTSQFTVVVANSWWNIYGNIIVLGVLFAVLLGVCIAIVHILIDRLLRWQAAVNQKLKDASDASLAASKAKSQFLAQMSHEIRTPINAVLGMNEMILRESKADEILEYATNIQSAGRTLLTLINSILDFSKIEDGKMEIIPVRYETIQLIDDLVNMISEKAKKKGLEFKTDIDSNLPQSLYGDDVRLRQIVTNILTNAVKYTHEGSVTLHMSGEELDDDTFELRVKISDTGIGIRKEDMSKLFQSFQRLDEERNRNIEGTGLGIAIVQKLLGMMGSTLEVASEYGHGSEFSFKLTQKIIDKSPVGCYDEKYLKLLDKNTENKFLTAADAKILAVDDNDMNLKVIRGLLKRNKIVPEIAESGEECIEMAKKNFYHIIFLDNMMPGMNGIETLKVMRRENILSDKTSVVMLTASAIAGMREAYLHEGFDDYLSKPIDVSELETILEKHLPSELVSFEVIGQKKIPEPPAQIETPPPEENEEPVGEDEFSKRERKYFAETCPDINLDTGLQYCMNSKSFFVEMLTAFTDIGRVNKIQNAFDSADWKNYQVLVHALKSTSLSIGAADLSQRAKNLELAAKNGKIDAVKAGHADLMTTYQKIREQISNWLGIEIVSPEEEEEPVGEDEFSKRERKIFAQTCPDIDFDTGLQYCTNSKSFFIEMLTAFTDIERVNKIQNAFDSANWKNYKILVHALKSTSLSIGAADLSRRAKKLELAAKDNNIDAIKTGHADLMTAYQKVRNQISNWLGARQ